jgi:hypothetical protein
MNKTKTLKKTAALLLGLALTVGATGCNFIVTNSEEDLAQDVATVNITAQLKKNNEYKAYADEVEKVLGDLSTVIKKRDLVSMFLSTGYQYVENYGYTYEDTFNMLMENLVSREIMIQMAVAYFLKNGLKADLCNKWVDDEIAAAKKANAKQGELLDKHSEVLVLKYFLTDGGKKDAESMKDYDLAVYNLRKSLNTSLDSLEASYIAETESHDHGETRKLPTNVSTEKEDYYTNDYVVYTGRNKSSNYGKYEPQEGSTKTTRLKAYNSFLANLQGYDLIGEKEDTQDVEQLEYFYVELASVLGQSLINKYYDALEKNISDKLTAEYMATKYEELYKQNEQDYATNPTAFATALDSASDTSFNLYGLKDFGYVYNILLPFSAAQNIQYTEAKNKGLTSDQLYTVRKNLLANVKGEDQRGSWISEHDHANYSYQKGGKYYFFEENFGESPKYETLKQYAGTYAYNGEVKLVDGELKATPNSVTIDDFIGIMQKQIHETVTGEKWSKETSIAKGSYQAAYGVDAKDTVYADKIKEGDYSQFIYYMGKTDLGTVNAKDYFSAESNIYKAVSAVNELMFAYSTDPGCLNTYYGYAVSPLGTKFVKEFEYAAQKVVENGVGSYAVCATDYGWHILYASYVFDGGEVYGGYNHAEAVGDNMVKGSFSNLFYEALKATDVNTYSTQIENSVLNRYHNDDNVTLYKSRYKDLLELK